MADAFDRLDHSDTGYISKEDLASLLGRDKDSEDVKKLIEEADTDKDGQSKYYDLQERKRSLSYMRPSLMFTFCSLLSTPSFL